MNFVKITFLKNISLLLLCTLLAGNNMAQVFNKSKIFTRQDTLRGSIGTGRIGWDVLHYDITVQPDFTSKTISGKNTIRFSDEGTRLLQIDLQEPMLLDSVISENKSIPFYREGNVYWLTYNSLAPGSKTKPVTASMTLYFHGKPREAKTPPWDGGWIWKKDKNGNPWMSVACQGLGASAWYPCKDHQSDKPDNGAILRIIVPDSLTAVGNGRLTGKKELDNGFSEFTWEVTNPINTYNIVPYIGKYSHFNEIYDGEKTNAAFPSGHEKLDMDYWVLDYNLDKAKKQFTDAGRTMKAFEHWFGPYPFYEDGYKLVESPHLGMEHQSAVAYGNGYQNGYMGRDLSGTGWGMKFDFIIVHESGHEWFANSITTNDVADMWVHEGFTNYSETLFTDYYYGKEAGNDYVIGTRKNIANDIPIIGKYGVSKEGSGDMYYKAGNMIHMIRQIINDDEKFRNILRGLNKTFYHQTVTTAQVENYISTNSGINFSKVFDQYLRQITVPVLEYELIRKKLCYRWTNCVDGFDMPVKIGMENDTTAEKWIYPKTRWKKIKIPSKFSIESFKVNRNFYVQHKKRGSFTAPF